MDNIEKLKEKVDKDPSSKLFVPLAEEYRKAGMLDMAVNTLRKGLDRQPAYMSARVSLGKIYMEMKKMSEAKVEFEKVIDAIPDNLFARRKLADIYRALGDTQKAIEQYKTVLKLNPFDEEAKAIQSELEGGTRPETEALEKPEAFMEEVSENAPTEEIPSFESFEDTSVEFPEEAPTEEESIENIEELPGEELLEVIGEVQEGEEALEAEALEVIEDEDMPFGEFALEAEPIEAVALAEEIPEEMQEEIPDEETISLPDESLEETGISLPGLEELTEISGETYEEDLSSADSLVAEGQYIQAMAVYRDILKSNPDDNTVMQRAVELKTLLKLLGKEKDIIESNLQSFLEGIKKRRDEFFGSA